MNGLFAVVSRVLSLRLQCKRVSGDLVRCLKGNHRQKCR
jgi:hypothetical protein